MKFDRAMFDRLFRSAAQTRDESQPEMPFGFDTRVLAHVREGGVNGVASLVRRVALLAACVIVIASAAVYERASKSEQSNDTLSSAYAMADTAIESALSP